jgi:hypothetical protein
MRVVVISTPLIPTLSREERERGILAFDWRRQT